MSQIFSVLRQFRRIDRCRSVEGGDYVIMVRKIRMEM
jgi:hypothetical protein